MHQRHLWMSAVMLLKAWREALSPALGGTKN
jgi:hypothetical protein